MSTKRVKHVVLGSVLAIAAGMAGAAWAQGGASAAGGAQTEHKARVMHRSARVEGVQRMLNQHGANLKVDGHLGPMTRKALKKYQGENGLKATGRLDKATLEKLGVK